MPLDNPNKKLVTLNTHHGLYHYNRLPFGVASAPALFQRAMDTILEGVPNVICYIDDILAQEAHMYSTLAAWKKFSRDW